MSRTNEPGSSYYGSMISTPDSRLIQRESGPQVMSRYYGPSGQLLESQGPWIPSQKPTTKSTTSQQALFRRIFRR